MAHACPEPDSASQPIPPVFRAPGGAGGLRCPRVSLDTGLLVTLSVTTKEGPGGPRSSQDCQGLAHACTVENCLAKGGGEDTRGEGHTGSAQVRVKVAGVGTTVVTEEGLPLDVGARWPPPASPPDSQTRPPMPPGQAQG